MNNLGSKVFLAKEQIKHGRWTEDYGIGFCFGYLSALNLPFEEYEECAKFIYKQLLE